MKATNSQVFALLLVVSFTVTVDAVETSEVSFNRDVRPILSNYCFGCHGPDKHGRQADLRLDDRDAALESDAFHPGHASKSAMIDRILSTDPDSVMPPPKAGKSLKPEEIAILKKWIDEGAAYQSHWAFLPVPKVVLVPTLVPDSKINTEIESDSERRPHWIRSDIDRFVYQQLKSLRIEPAAEASRERWLRRVSLDLTGLPPTLTELDQFLSDTSSDAYERVVDRLLGSDAFGERMANMWLDVARYADTFGYQSDIDMDVWPWRDWVIRAFNQNLPYDEFILWQTAGDLLPESASDQAKLDQQLATTFNRLHRQTNEGGSIEEEFRQVYIADRTATNATAFLGMTFECARCHDHKYDPILQKDFYQLAAYFANIDEHGLYSHFTKTSPTPTLLLYDGDQKQQHQDSLSKIEKLRSDLQQATDAARDRFVASSSDLNANAITPPSVPVADLEFPLEGDIEGVVAKAMQFNGDDAYVCEKALQYGRNTPVSFSMWIKPGPVEAGGTIAPYQTVLHQSVAAEDSAFRGLQLVLRNGLPEFSLIHFWPGNAIRVTATETLEREEWTHLTITYDGSSSASGVAMYVNGSAVDLEVARDQLTRDILHRAEWHDSSPNAARLALGARFRDVGFRGGSLDQLQVFHRRLSSWEAALVASSNSEFKVTDEMKLDHFITNVDSEAIAASKALLDAHQQENEIVSKVRQIMTMKTAIVPRSTHLLLRGAYETPGELVQADTPSFLPKIKNANPENSVAAQDRLALAKWMIDDQNPLVSRVTVNRFWHLFFGRGLVASLDDFGNQGQPPTHPELLDWLARRFMDQGWNTKQLCREIVLSSVYRQSSVPRDLSLLESDPDNKHLARGPRHRLSAEQVRDSVLLASDLLVRTIGGPSVMPYQPAGLWEEAGTNKKYHQAKGDGLYRRSLYTFWRRTAPPPSMLTFDATSRETCTAKRELTSTPLQALILLNDPQYIEAARFLAQNLIASHPTDRDQRWRESFRRLTSRLPNDQELEVLRKLYDEQLAYFAANSDAAKSFVEVGEKPVPKAIDLQDLAATSVVVEAIISFDETITKR